MQTEKTSPLRTGTQRKIGQDSFDRKLEALAKRYTKEVLRGNDVPATHTAYTLEIMTEYQSKILELAKKVY